MINLGTSTMQDFALGDNLVERIDLGDTTIFDPYTTLTGNLPLSFNSRVAGALKNYRLYGDSDGSGVQTENLFDDAETEWILGVLDDNGQPTGSTSSHYTENYTEVEPETDYYWEGTIVSGTMGYRVYFYNQNKEWLSRSGSSRYFVTPANCKYIRLQVSVDVMNTSDWMITKGSTAPDHYIPPGYKIPILNTSGVTENLWDKSDVISATVAGATLKISMNPSWRTIYMPCEPNTRYTVHKIQSMYYRVAYTTEMPAEGVQTYGSAVDPSATDITYTTGNDAAYIVVVVWSTSETISLDDILNSIMIVKGSTAPDHYIPHRYTSNYDLMIGSTKLGEEEYVDFSEQKVYKDISGTLTPTDPPVPLPAVSAYKGENTLSSTETVGEVSVKGRISAISP